jgi:DNA-binding XRE family transcriptional regulator
VKEMEDEIRRLRLENEFLQAHLAEVHDLEVARQTISTITDKALKAWPHGEKQPLDPITW